MVTAYLNAGGKMYEVKLVDGSIQNIDADEIRSINDPCVTSLVELVGKDKDIVFFAPLTSILSIRKYEVTHT